MTGHVLEALIRLPTADETVSLNVCNWEQSLSQHVHNKPGPKKGKNGVSLRVSLGVSICNRDIGKGTLWTCESPGKKLAVDGRRWPAA